MSNPVIINKVVEANQIDHNNHMHDSEYNKVFSEAVNEFNYTHGLSLKEREVLQYTMFTLEEHTTYLAELSPIQLTESKFISMIMIISVYISF